MGQIKSLSLKNRKKDIMDTDFTKRFSDRVGNYVKYRPGYPSEIISFLRNRLGLNSASSVADIGSGTGISSEIFLKNGNKVFSVEPNDEMRKAAESALSGYSNYYSSRAQQNIRDFRIRSRISSLRPKPFIGLSPIKQRKSFIEY